VELQEITPVVSDKRTALRGGESEDILIENSLVGPTRIEQCPYNVP